MLGETLADIQHEEILMELPNDDALPFLHEACESALLGCSRESSVSPIQILSWIGPGIALH